MDHRRKMYGHNFKNFPQNVRIGAGMGPKSQNLFGLSVRPPKNQNLFGRGHQASKTANFRSDWPSGLNIADNCTGNSAFKRSVVDILEGDDHLECQG